MPVQSATSGIGPASAAGGSGADAAQAQMFANKAAETVFEQIFKILLDEIQKGGE